MNDAYAFRKAAGRKLSELRRAADMTQEEVAKQIGFDLKAYQRIEYGQRNITMNTIWRIAKALQIDLAQLIGKPTMPQLKRGRPLRTPPKAK